MKTKEFFNCKTPKILLLEKNAQIYQENAHNVTEGHKR